ncbi:hypothetical protein DOK78_000086 [Enterococcus sp. DIV2402]|uniref:HTH cro/C1-type domain-containing protein n=1 Tax=Candidatus Enterococcus lowellii TaxID=2230877 RepID=A0ABZ2SI42_9ENTE|nr:helix-turn-helix transcriptional regulator [Enterococcus sp. DIV2402]MBO0463115.1 helix-turn-helix transcriptional regulator [Enterococcus sp. DIV2402]
MIKDMIKSKRKELNMTQEILAEKLNVSRTTVSSWETGRTYPDLDMVVKLSEEFKVSLDYLLLGDEVIVNKISKDTRKGRILKKIIWIVIFLFLLLTIYSLIWKVKTDNLYRNLDREEWKETEYGFYKKEDSIGYSVNKIKTYKIWEIPSQLDLIADANSTHGDESFINGVSIIYSGTKEKFLVSWLSRNLSGQQLYMDSSFTYKETLQPLEIPTISYEFQKIFDKELDIERPYLLQFLNKIDSEWKKIN